jgi:hypothetical protein
MTERAIPASRTRRIGAFGARIALALAVLALG